jgi:hypothetical protein
VPWATTRSSLTRNANAVGSSHSRAAAPSEAARTIPWSEAITRSAANGSRAGSKPGDVDFVVVDVETVGAVVVVEDGAVVVDRAVVEAEVSETSPPEQATRISTALTPTGPHALEIDTLNIPFSRQSHRPSQTLELAQLDSPSRRKVPASPNLRRRSRGADTAVTS